MPEEVYHKAFNYGYSTVSDLIERRPESGALRICDCPLGTLSIKIDYHLVAPHVFD